MSMDRRNNHKYIKLALKGISSAHHSSAPPTQSWLLSSCRCRPAAAAVCELEGELEDETEASRATPMTVCTLELSTAAAGAPEMLASLRASAAWAASACNTG